MFSVLIKLSAMWSLLFAGVKAGPIDQGQLTGMVWDAQKQDYVSPAPEKWWTYHFGKGAFLHPDWQGRLQPQPTDEFGCVLVVQNVRKVRDSFVSLLSCRINQSNWF